MISTTKEIGEQLREIVTRHKDQIVSGAFSDSLSEKLIYKTAGFPPAPAVEIESPNYKATFDRVEGKVRRGDGKVRRGRGIVTGKQIGRAHV